MEGYIKELESLKNWLDSGIKSLIDIGVNEKYINESIRKTNNRINEIEGIK